MGNSVQDKVVVVTGAGGGIGREMALAMAANGAKVVVNDIGAGLGGELSSDSAGAAQKVVNEIKAAGGTAVANTDSVSTWASAEHIIQCALDNYGRIDGVVNNAGILRDKTFAKMDIADFALVVDVHLMGAVHCCKAVWPLMNAQKYGRIVMTTSSSGLYGNFGQSNYGAAKMALVGLMQTLALEGVKNNIHVNALAPTAATRMTEGLMPEAVLAALKPEAVVPAMLVLASREAPTRTILCAGAGTFEAAHITLTQGVWLGTDPQTPERLAERLAEVSDPASQMVPQGGSAQGANEVAKAMAQLGSPA